MDEPLANLTLFLYAAMAYFFARKGGWEGIIGGHFVIGILAVVLDAIWVDHAIRQPDWNGTPDFDGPYAMFMPLKIVMLNTMLLPVSFFGLWRFNMAQEK